MMKFKSTRGSDRELTGAQAIIQGISEDKGLYVPTEIPALPFKIEDMIGKSYQEIAFKVIGAFFDDYTEEEMKYCIDGAYDEKFEAILPLKLVMIKRDCMNIQRLRIKNKNT